MRAQIFIPGDGKPDGGPEAKAVHWTPARKEEVLRRLDEGLIGLNDALRIWNLTLEEVEAWRAAHAAYGRRGLRLGQHRAEVPRPTQRTLL
jgi:hypothetical protein